MVSYSFDFRLCASGIVTPCGSPHREVREPARHLASKETRKNPGSRPSSTTVEDVLGGRFLAAHAGAVQHRYFLVLTRFIATVGPSATNRSTASTARSTTPSSSARSIESKSAST